MKIDHDVLRYLRYTSLVLLCWVQYVGGAQEGNHKGQLEAQIMLPQKNSRVLMARQDGSPFEKEK